MPNIYWHSPETIPTLNRLDRAGFAMEFLRRNPSYRRDYSHVLRRINRRGLDAKAAFTRLGHHWGLQFRP